MNLSIKIALILQIFCFNLFAGSLKEEIKKDSMLSNGFTGFIEFKNDKYLISVGILEIKNNSLQSKLNAIKGAKILAQSKLVKFIHNVKIKSVQELTETTVTTKFGKDIKYIIKSEYIENIKEQSNGILKKTVDIGKWKDKHQYFYALGVKL